MGFDCGCVALGGQIKHLLKSRENTKQEIADNQLFFVVFLWLAW